MLIKYTMMRANWMRENLFNLIYYFEFYYLTRLLLGLVYKKEY